MRSKYQFFGTFRFLLAVMVVLSHSGQMGGADIVAMFSPLGLGDIAVMTFFSLSGYIISEAFDKFYAHRVGGFLVNRFLRIIPPYLVALVISISLHLWLAQIGKLQSFDYQVIPHQIFKETNMLANFLLIVVLYGLGHVGLQPDYTFVRYVWAVRVELHFYLVYALLFWLISRCRDFRAGFSMVMTIAFSAFTAISIIAMTTGLKQLNYFNYAPYFMFGVAIYFASKRECTGAWYAAAVSFLLSVMHFATYVINSPNRYVVAPTVTLGLLLLLIPALANVNVSKHCQKIDQWLGDLSYPIYLNHYVVTICVFSLLPQRNPEVFFLTIVLCIAISWLAAQLTEPFTIGLRNKIRGTALR